MILRALSRLVLFVSLGFGIGLAVGLVSEEPDLVLGHISGEGETVPLVDAAAESDSIIEAPIALTNEPESGDAGDSRLVAGTEAGADPQSSRLALQRKAEREKPLPKVAAPAAPAPRAVVAERPAPKKPKRKAVAPVKPTAAADDDQTWAIQVGAFAEEASARRLAASLEEKGYPTAVVPSDGANARWRVRVQPIGDEELAQGLASRLKSEEGLPTWLMAMEAGSR